MSTGLECQLRELAPGQWFYVLQDWSCPVGAFDWTDYASVVGPYVSEDAAHEGLSKNEANPGGYMTVPYAEGKAARNAELLARARRPRRA